MKRIIINALAVVLTVPALVAGADLRALCDSPPEFHTETVTSARKAYTVRMGGKLDGAMTRDPVGYWGYDQYWTSNIYLELKNTGNTAVVNPWIMKKGATDFRSLESIAASVLRPGMIDEEKARAMWEFEISHRFHATTEDNEVKDAVKMLNCYGYTLCYDESLVMSDLWRAAGLRVRRGFPNGHSTAEVFYGGAWHHLDSDESIICLLRDNRTIASEPQIVADHDLMKRTHTYGPLHDDNRLRDEGSVSLHFFEGERKGEHPSLTSHEMKFTLRPGESIRWAWNPGGRFHGKAYQDSETQSYYWNKRWRLIANVMNGELEWNPDFTDSATLGYVEASGVELRPDGPFGAGLYLSSDSGSVTVPVESAYPVVGGRLEVDFARRDMRSENLRVMISYDRGESWREVWTSSGFEYTRLYIDLDEFFPMHDPARYHYLLRFDLLSDAREPLVWLEGAHISSTLQMSRLSLPAITLGRNEFIYTDESPGARRVRITHAWRECDRPLVPGTPAGAVSPPDGGVSDGTQVEFRWTPPADGARATDYEWQLSEYEDFRWVLSPNFHKLISRTAFRGAESYCLPCPGLLNPGQKYYWRVRARSAEGVWGPWSETFSFTPEAPAVPLELRAVFDESARRATLSWMPGENGAAPVRYRIYGSRERGFTASDTSYIYDAGLDGLRRSPPNLLLETSAQETSVSLPAELWRPWYRVSAVDPEGRESGPSALAEMNHPLIMTESLPRAAAGQYYEAKLEVSSSIGHLVSRDENGKPYQKRFRAGDELVFALDGAPDGLSITPEGLLAGYLPSGSAGEYRLLVRVSDSRAGGSDSREFLFRVAGSAAEDER